MLGEPDTVLLSMLSERLLILWRILKADPLSRIDTSS
jgi:hypothetical protein